MQSGERKQRKCSVGAPVQTLITLPKKHDPGRKSAAEVRMRTGGARRYGRHGDAKGHVRSVNPNGFVLLKAQSKDVNVVAWIIDHACMSSWRRMPFLTHFFYLSDLRESCYLTCRPANRCRCRVSVLSVALLHQGTRGAVFKSPTRIQSESTARVFMLQNYKKQETGCHPWLPFTGWMWMWLFLRMTQTQQSVYKLD